MRRSWFLLFAALLLAACSSAPPRADRSGWFRGPDARRTVPRGLPHFVDHSIGREEISVEAMSLVGVPYRWAGNTPSTGFDCSGFVQYVLKRAAGVRLPRTTAQMSHSGKPIEPDEIASGDLVFFNTTGRPHSHVGIYVGNLRFINAPSTGGTVRLDYLTNPYWARHFDGIRRVAPPLAPATPFDAPVRLAGQAPETPPTVPAQSVATSPDAIDAAADAFEPPPPAAVAAAQQARREGARIIEPTQTGAEIIRTSPHAGALPATTTTHDDPIARFATNGE